MNNIKILCACLPGDRPVNPLLLHVSKMCKYQFVLLYIIFCYGLAFSQSEASIIIHVPSNGAANYAISRQGNLIFTLPDHHKFLVEKTRNADRSVLLECVYVYDINRGPLVVRGDSCFYLLSPDGQFVKKYREYGTIYSAWDGFLIARLRKEDYRERDVYQYLTATGELAFDGRSFLYATNFSEGKAIVQTMDSNWEILNTEGQIVGKIPVALNANMDKAYPFYQNLALVRTRLESVIGGESGRYSFYFINPKGEQVFSLLDLLGREDIFATSGYEHTHAVYQVDNDVIFFDTLGKEVLRISNISNIINLRSQFCWLLTRDNTKIVISMKEPRIIELPKNDNEDIIPDKVYGNVIQVYYHDKTTDTRGNRYVDLRTMETLFETNHRVLDVVGDVFICGSENYPHDLYFIKDFKGKYLFISEYK